MNLPLFLTLELTAGFLSQATALGVVGDAVAQRLERRWNPGQRYEMKRTVHAGILNMIIGTHATDRLHYAVCCVDGRSAKVIGLTNCCCCAALPTYVYTVLIV